MQKAFEEKIMGIVSGKKENCSFLTAQQYANRIKAVKQAKQAVGNKNEKKLPVYYRLMKRFDVITVDGKEKLIKKVTDDTKPILYFVHKDEVFDILHAAHMTTGHGGRNRMMQELRKKYCNITREVVMVYLNLCLSCKKKTATPKTNPEKKNPVLDSKAEVNVIDMAHRDGYQYMLIHEDCRSKFIVLKALKTKQTEEIVDNLLDTYAVFGAPAILHSNSGSEFVDALIKRLSDEWPELKMVRGKRSAWTQSNISTAVSEWMKENNTTDWVKALKFVQFRRNTTANPTTGKSPFEEMFGSKQMLGLRTTDIPAEAVDVIHTEEDLEIVLSNDDDVEHAVDLTLPNADGMYDFVFEMTADDDSE